MNLGNKISILNKNHLGTSFLLKKLGYIMIFISGVCLLKIPQARSDVIFLKCTGKFEINRGELIKPDWETSYLTINQKGLISTINDKGVKKEGRTLIRGNTYTITHRDNTNRIKTKYKVNKNHGTYLVEYPQTNKILLGICEKGRG